MLQATNQKYQIHIQGTVQGVGFRPFIYRIAHSLSVKGWVRNTYFGAEIQCECTEPVFEQFLKKIQEQHPKAAQITDIKWNQLESEAHFTDFNIDKSVANHSQMGQITPEHAICEDCLKEVSDPQNRRYAYPFTTCSTCGPRYGIIKKLPFDRENTSMNVFELCEVCTSEYLNVNDRRFHAQTISCETCGPKLSAFIPSQNKWISGNQNCIAHLINILKDGKIVAVKSLGGFLLLCDASNSESILELRQRKNRPSKPLAMLFPKHFSLEPYFEITAHEKAILRSKIAPIVLLKAKKNSLSKLICTHEIAPQLHKFGVMLPATALLHTVSEQFGKPIIATSANVSGSPIVFENEVAISELSTIADCIVTDDRALLLGQDDSVIQFAGEQKIILRRARGLAPNYGTPAVLKPTDAVALGAGLKHTFGVFKNPYLYVSQYFGDTETLQSQENIKTNVDHLSRMLNLKNETILSDGHPSYFSTQWGASKNALQIPHHHAHFSAVLAENELFDKSVMGVIFDGSGWHPDGHIRGGEFYHYEHRNIHSIGSFEPFQHILGNKMAAEPRISALSLTHTIPYSALKNQFSTNEWNYYQKLLVEKKGIPSHSVGRIFDAMASILELCSVQEYEGKAALQLEHCAASYSNNDLGLEDHYLPQNVINEGIPSVTMLKNSIQDLELGIEKPKIAYKFHLTLVVIIKQMALKHGFEHLAFSGGVFQNSLLVRLLIQHLSPNFKLYFHKNLSPNDESISFGQLNYYLQSLNS